MDDLLKKIKRLEKNLESVRELRRRDVEELKAENEKLRKRLQGLKNAFVEFKNVATEALWK